MSTKVVSLRIPEDTYCKLENKAVNEGKQIGILVKEIAEKYVNIQKNAKIGGMYRILSYLNLCKVIESYLKVSKVVKGDIKSSKVIESNLKDDKEQQNSLKLDKLQESILSIQQNYETVNKRLEEIKDLISGVRGNQQFHFDTLEYFVSHAKDDICDIVAKLGR